MAELLLFNIQDPEKLTAIRLTALRLGLQWKSIPPELQRETIETLLKWPGGTAGTTVGTAKEASGASFTDEMLLMHALSQSDFHMLLDTLRTNGQSIRLKAVVTDYNRKWTAGRLHRELCAEEAAMQRRKQQNNRGNR